MPLALLLACVASTAQTFDDPYTIRTDLRATAAQAVDIDGDGDLDLALAENDSIAWLRNLGEGPRGHTRLAGPRVNDGEVTGMVWIDDDGDGDVDLIRTAAHSQTTTLARIENLGGGVFAAPQELPMTSNVAGSLLVADLNNDGNPDLILRDGQLGFVWRAKTGPGTYGPSQTLQNTPSGAETYALQDVNVDGNLDFIASTAQGRIRLYLGNGAGGFTVGTQIANFPHVVTQLTSADVDQDGDQDLVLSASSLVNIRWLEQTGAGYSPVRTLVPALHEVASLEYADMDGDGIGDIVCARFEGKDTVWVRGLGGGTFATAQILMESRRRMNLVVVGDFDRDGDEDTIAGTSDISSVVSTRLTLVRNDGAGQAEEVLGLHIQPGGIQGTIQADMDGDGDLDFCAASYLDSSLHWIENLGGGEPGFQRELHDIVGNFEHLEAMEVPTGARPTLILADREQSGTVARLRSFRLTATGGVSIQTLVDDTDADFDVSFARGDWNGDGRQDLVSASKRFLEPWRFRWYEGPLISIRGTRDLDVNVVRWLEMMDVDSDGDDDVLIQTNAGLKWIECVAGQFDGPVAPFWIGGNGGICVASFDGDGLDDFVGGSRFFQNLGGGTFAAPVNLMPGLMTPVSPEAADWDGDGDLDLMFSGNQVPFRVAENLGGNTFGVAVLVPTVGREASGTIVLDLDGDQDLDLVNGSFIQLNLRYFGRGHCGPANPNPTGLPGVVFAEGSDAVAANDITLGAGNLPVGAFGYFLTSLDTGFVPFAGGSQGNLCLGGSIGRYNRNAQEILQADASGLVSLTIDLNDIPSPLGTVVASPGNTRYFQYWTRIVSGGVPTSNFSNALGVELR